MKLFNIQNRDLRIKHGYIYNQWAVADTDFCPANYRVPFESDWLVLKNYISANGLFDSEAAQLKSIRYWFDEPFKNDRNFNLLPCGYRHYNGDFYPTYKNQGWYNWTWTNSTAGNSLRVVGIKNGGDTDNIEFYNSYEAFGQTVRLLYTGGGTPITVTDYDGNVYPVVKIGTQYWVAQNWKCTRLNNGESIPTITDGTVWGSLNTKAKCSFMNDETLV